MNKDNIKSFFKRNWPLIVGGILCLVFLIGLISTRRDEAGQRMKCRENIHVYGRWVYLQQVSIEGRATMQHSCIYCGWTELKPMGYILNN